MKVMTLKRVALNEDVTLGVLLDEPNKPFCLTLELPWKNNQSNISCIPKGEYTCKRTITPKHGETFEIIGVPGRFAVLLHWGNTVKDSAGCIILGEEFGDMDDVSAVMSSRRALTEFMRRVAGHQEIKLCILEV